MARAAAAYALHFAAGTYTETRSESLDIAAGMAWPWSHGEWKPKDPRRDLIRAAALIVAEIERLDRLPTPPHGEEG